MVSSITLLPKMVVAQHTVSFSGILSWLFDLGIEGYKEACIQQQSINLAIQIWSKTEKKFLLWRCKVVVASSVFTYTTMVVVAVSEKRQMFGLYPSFEETSFPLASLQG